MKYESALRLFIPLVLLCAACGQQETSTGYWSDDTIYMQRFKMRVEQARIPFTLDERGQVSWSVHDSRAAEQIRLSLEREMYGGLAIRFGSLEANQYFRKLLDARKLKYLIEPRTDGEWTRWYPEHEGQAEELRQLVMAFESERAQVAADSRCEEVPISGELNQKFKVSAQKSLPRSDC